MAKERAARAECRARVAEEKVRVLLDLVKALEQDVNKNIKRLLELGDEADARNALAGAENQAISAKSRVLNSPELLEQILSYVPMYELLCSQRVCRTWRAIITESPSLQQALFFRPLRSSSVCSDSWLLSTLNRRNPNCFNPLLQEVFEEWFQYSGYFGPSRTGSEVEYVASVPMRRDKPEIFTRRDASWRRMLYQQPIDESQGTLVCYKGRYGVRQYECVHIRAAATLGEVYDLVNYLGEEDAEDDLRWLFFMKPGSQAKPRFGTKAEKLVEEEWGKRQLWYERNGRHERGRADWLHKGSSREVLDFRRP